MSALGAVETLRQRRLERNRRNAGLGFRYGDAFTSPAEEAAARLAQAEADRELVAAELAKHDEDAERDEALRAEVEPLLAPARAAYLDQSSVLRRDLNALHLSMAATVKARTEYDRLFWLADKLGVEQETRIRPAEIGAELQSLTNTATLA